MAVRVNRTDLPDVPCEPDGVAGALLRALNRAHELEGLPLEDALAVRRGAVAQVEVRVREDVGDVEPDAAGRDARRRRERTLECCLPVARRMAGREPVDDEVAGGRPRVLEA